MAAVVTYADQQKKKDYIEQNNQQVTARQEGNSAASKVENSSYNGSVDVDMTRDYTAELRDAVASGDKALAAQLEQLRNAKIERLNKEGGGKNQWDAKPSYEYSAYLGANAEKVNDGTKPSYADSYEASDPNGVGNAYAKEHMEPYQLKQLEEYGNKWNEAAAAEEQALASAKSEAERTAIKTYYGQIKDYWHGKAETVRSYYDYSGGEDGSEYISSRPSGLGGGIPSGTQTRPSVTLPSATQIPTRTDLSGLKKPSEATKIPDAPDFTSLLDQWLSNAQKQQEAKIDYATQQGITQLERAEQDAQQQFQTQRDQVSADEAKALDNQALYAERRGDKGGIGAVQYAAVQNAAMEQRRAVNQAQTKLSTDTARQIADLRSQGEFEKADALLDISQTYLSKLIEVQQWNAEYSMQKAQLEESIRQWEAGYQLDVAQFEENIRQWEASFQESIRQWEAEFQESIRQWEAEFGLSEGSLTGSYKGNATLDGQKMNTSTMADAGWTMLKNGILPSVSQLSAMGISSSQAQEYLTALKLSQSVSGSGNNSTPKPKDESDDLTISEKLKTFKTESEAWAYLLDQNISDTRRSEFLDWFIGYQKQKENEHTVTSPGVHNILEHGSMYTYATYYAQILNTFGASEQEKRDFLNSFQDKRQLTDADMLEIAGLMKITL